MQKNSSRISKKNINKIISYYIDNIYGKLISGTIKRNKLYEKDTDDIYNYRQSEN